MSHGRKGLERARLYLVLDAQVTAYAGMLRILKQAVAAGVDVVQLRDKYGPAQEIVSFGRQAMRVLRGRVPFIVNDRVDLALAVGADGVHLGQEDLPVAFARRWLGRRRIIGVSCQTLAHARRAQAQGADYIGFGSVFKTQTKPDRLPMDLRRLVRVNHAVRIPVFAIGGINSRNVQRLVSLGASRVAVTRSICLAADVKKTVRMIRKELTDDEKA